jgi:hypothetical protein
MSIVVFDSQAPVGEGQGVYMSAVAEVPTGADLERGIEILSRVSLSHGARPWTLEDVLEPASLRCIGRAYPSTGCWTRSAGPTSGRASGRSGRRPPSMGTECTECPPRIRID